MPLQPLADLEKWYNKFDPWEYESTFDDVKRKDILFAELPKRKYKRVLDIGCGHGFVTRDLPGKKIVGVDISVKAIKQANQDKKKRKLKHVEYLVGDLFSLSETLKGQKFDLILITGVLYPQYIGKSYALIYEIIDRLLAKDGVLVSVQIDDWYFGRFPYLQLQEYFYNYRHYTHRLEVYLK